MKSKNYTVKKAINLKPKKIIIKPSVLTVIERIANVSKKGTSKFISILPTDLREHGCKSYEIKMFQSNNGVPYLRKDAPLSRKYIIERKYDKHNGSLLGFKLNGFNKTTYFSRSIPQEVRKATLEKYGHKCIWCGSTDRLEVDHKNGRYNTLSNDIKDFQILCKSCNDKKRERCKRCQVTGQRFNVQKAISNVLYKIPFTCGGEKYNENKEACKGCFLYDIEDFYAKNAKKYCNTNAKISDTDVKVEVTIRRKSTPTKNGKVVYTQSQNNNEIFRLYNV